MIYPSNETSAELMHQQLEEQITEAYDSLEDNEDLQIGIFRAPKGFILDAVGFSVPELLFFYGHIYDGGEEVRLLQHVSQVNFYLKIVKRDTPGAPRRKIEFSFDD